MRIAVIGAGGWGSAAASLLSASGHQVRLLARRAEAAEAINRTHINQPYLPAAPLDPGIIATSDPYAALQSAHIVVIAVPSAFLRTTLSSMKDAFGAADADATVVSLVKGLDPSTHQRMSQIIAEILEVHTARVAALSGPNHAEEVARGIPSATVVAGTDSSRLQLLQNAFMAPSFRVYANPDIVGVELCGASKNVIAIASGIADGLGFGDNTRATLITRGLAEMSRLGAALGADRNTFAGLAGLGDLVATCTSRHSRNRALGERIGSGESLEEATAETPKVAEGAYAARGLSGLAVELGVDLPITAEVAKVLYEGKSPAESVRDLMTRGAASE